jgi:hypothetical protein
MGLFSRLKSYILLLSVVLALFFPLACNSQEREQSSGQDQAIDDSLSGGTVTSVYDEVLNIAYTQIPGVASNLTSLD